ncbi:MAG: hypothetical protein AAF598_10200 [Bacteroidota bacterium]
MNTLLGFRFLVIYISAVCFIAVSHKQIIAQSLIGQEVMGDITSDLFGISGAISGDGNRIAIGARDWTETVGEPGQLRIYDLENNTWVLSETITGA